MAIVIQAFVCLFTVPHKAESILRVVEAEVKNFPDDAEKLELLFGSLKGPLEQVMRNSQKIILCKTKGST